MAANSKKGKAIQFQIGWAGLIALIVSCVCVLLWTFVLGFWMGQKVATGNAEKPAVSVYSPKAQTATTGEAQMGKSENEVNLARPIKESASKEFSALRESLKEEMANDEGIKTEVLPGSHNVASANTTNENIPSKESVATAVPETKSQKRAEVHEEVKAKEEVKKTETKPKKKSAKKVKTEKIVKKAKETPRPFALQIASYRTMAQARKEASRWKKKGYYVRIRSADLGRKGIWYRVYLGRYKSLEEAKKASIRLASKEGIRSYVTKVTK